MKILVISDSHNKSITKLDLDKYDYILCCGDILASDIDYQNIYPNLYIVKGNCDWGLNLPLSKVIEINNKTYYLTHSNIYHTKYSLDNLIENTKNKYDFVLYGHTHRQNYIKVDKTIYLNPGAFKDGYYLEIIDNEIIFYKNKQIEQKINIEI